MLFVNFASPDPGRENHLQSPWGNHATGTQSKQVCQFSGRRPLAAG